jgi:hypothetical protein
MDPSARDPHTRFVAHSFSSVPRACTFSPIIEMPTVMTAVWRRMGVHLFEGRLSVDDMDRLDELGANYRKRVPGKMVELVVIYPSDARMTSDERARMAKIVKRWEHERTASSTVILADGLMGSLHRSILTGLQLLVPAPHPVKVFGAIAPAVQFLAPFVHDLCGPEATTDALLAGVEELCERFAARDVR